MKESSRFLPFLPDVSSFSPIFPDYSPLFWQIFRCQGWHSGGVSGKDCFVCISNAKISII